MMTALTREQIEETFDEAWKSHDSLSGEMGCPPDKEFKARLEVCKALALRGLDTVPRPLAELDGPALAIYRNAGARANSYVIVAKRPNGTWASHSLGAAWPDDTLAVPLSALPEPKP